MKAQSVARNTTVLTSAYILQKVFAFVYFTMVARYIGPGDVGKYAFAVSLTTLLAIFMDLGLTPVMIRELAKDHLKTNEYSRVILTVKVFLGILIYIIAQIIVRFLHKDPVTISMVTFTGIAMVLDSFTLTLWGILRSKHNLLHESISTIFNQVIITVVGLAGLYLHFPLTVLAIALAFGSAFSFGYSLTVNLVYKYIVLKPYFHFNTLVQQLRESIAFALAGIFTRVYSYLDQVLLSLMVGNVVLGWYSVAYKITFAFQFLPSAFAASIYPAMSAAAKHDPARLSKLFERSMYFLALLSIPLSVGIFVIAPRAVTYFYGSRFLESILPLQILILALPAVFLSFPVGAMLNSTGKQHINTINLGITMVINVVANLILIPRFQQVGASIAATMSLYYLLTSNWMFVGVVANYSRSFLAKKIFGISIAALFMGALAYAVLQLRLPLLLSIVSAAALYVVILYGFKIVTVEDTKKLVGDVLRKPVEEQI